MVNPLRALRDYFSSKAARQVPFQGENGGQGWFPFFTNFTQFTGTRINFAAEVGDLANSELVAAAVRWIGKNIPTARMYVAERDSENKENEIADHPLIQLFEQPNPYYGIDALSRGIAASWVVKATAYILKYRNGFGQPYQLWYEPHSTIRPRWNMSGGGEFISHFEVWRNGAWYRVETDDVIVFRDGINPSTREGDNGVTALLREFYTDNQAAHFMALLLKQGLVPPLALGFGDAKTPGPSSGPEWEDIKEQTRRQMTGDKAAMPLMYRGPIKAEKLGFDYSSVGMREVRRIPEERFCAVIGISPQSLRLGLGQENSTYNNVEQYTRADYNDYIKPLHKIIARELTLQLLPDFGDTTGLKIGWDYTDTGILQPDQKSEWERIGAAWDDGRLKRSEAREAMGYEFNEKTDAVYKLKATESLIDESGEVVAPQAVDNPSPDMTAPIGTIEPAKPNGEARPS